MTEAHETVASAKPSLGQQANSPRVGRARFIGHAIGYFILTGAVLGAVFWLSGKVAGLTAPNTYTADFTAVNPAVAISLTYPGLNGWLAMVLAVLASLLWTDIIVRRRRDRGRSGVDGMIWQLLLLVSVGLHVFNVVPQVVGYLDALLALSALYLLVVLVLLPGTPGPNRYGDDPRVVD